MPRGRPKSIEVSAKTRAILERLEAKTEDAQAVIVQEKLDEVARFQARLEGELESHFLVLKGLRDQSVSKEEAPGARIRLEAARTMMEHTHRLHPERGGQSGPPMTVNVLVQMLTKPTGGREG